MAAKRETLSNLRQKSRMSLQVLKEAQSKSFSQDKPHPRLKDLRSMLDLSKRRKQFLTRHFLTSESEFLKA